MRSKWRLVRAAIFGELGRGLWLDSWANNWWMTESVKPNFSHSWCLTPPNNCLSRHVYTCSQFLSSFFHLHFPPQTAIKSPVETKAFRPTPGRVQQHKTQEETPEGGDPLPSSLWVGPPSPGLSKKEPNKPSGKLYLWNWSVIPHTEEGGGRTRTGKRGTQTAHVTLSLKGYQK